MPVRILFYNADVVTMEEGCPTAQAVMIEDGIIRYVGNQEEILSKIKNDDSVSKRDMEGRTILPGFVDGHSHLITSAYDKLFANAGPGPKGSCNTVEELVVEMRKELAQKEEREGSLTPDQWFIGMGYDNSVYPDGAHPTKYDLDRISCRVPICITHASGHCAVFNSRALHICGIGEGYPVPEGGSMPRIAGANPGSGEYSGLLQEKAFFNQTRFMTFPGAEAMVEAIGGAVDMYVSQGFTTAQDAKVGVGEMKRIRLAQETGKLTIDLVCYIDDSDSEKLLPRQDPWKNPYDHHVRLAGCKLFLDGSPQAKTAWLTEPYYQTPEGESADYRGYPRMEDEELTDRCVDCLRNHWQMNVHTNGDAAIGQFIRCYRRAMEQIPDAPDLRPVSIHCQTVREDQLDEMKEIGMLASFFCDHVYYWGDYHYESSLGPERASRISPVRSAAERGINYTLHQDTPVVEPDALFAVHNAVNRRTRKGRLLGEDQRISVEEALKGVTINAAYQLFEEDRKGSLAVGKAGDLVILDGNPLKTPADHIKDIRVLETIKNGVSVYCSDGSPNM